MEAKIAKDEHLQYLDELRDEGSINMFAAGSFLQSRFGLTRSEARAVLKEWMETFDERHGDAA